MNAIIKMPMFYEEVKNMKILAISGSPRKDGNTVILLNEALKGAQQEGAETELYSTSGKTIAPCDACISCRKTGRCHIDDDMQELYPKLREADGIIIGTPIYHYTMAAQTKAIIDRTFSLDHNQVALANKVGGVVVVAASLGVLQAVKDLYFYFISMQMLPANFIAAYANAKGEAKNLEKCLIAARGLGRQMVLIAAKKFEYPKEIESAKFGYGTWIK
jgi:multimeric flavodoxin WrbA